MKFGKRALSIFKKTETIVICAVLAALMLAYYLYSTSSRNAYPEAAYGKPAVSTEYPKMDISMEQVVEAGQYLYVLYAIMAFMPKRVPATGSGLWRVTIMYRQ